MQFVDLLENLPGVKASSGDADIESVSIHSLRCEAGSLFVCLPGEHVDSHGFIPQALNAGAVGAVVTDEAAFQELVKRGVVAALVDDARDTCWRLCKRLYRDPSARMRLVGVTGTNGKTTVAWLLNQVLEKLGDRSGYLGTLGARVCGETLQTSLTTPFAPETYTLLAAFEARGASTVVMEVSSHALAQRRIDGLEFDVAVFTNLSQDHLDFHGDMESYFRAKRRLFDGLPKSKSLVTVANADDPFGRRLLQNASQAISFGAERGDLRLTDAQFSFGSLSFSATYQGSKFKIEASLGARFNVMNCLAVLATAIAMSVEPARAARALSSVRPVPGRFESVPAGSELKVIVDYAHTPDALEKLLQSVRELNPARVIAVFGCGGDRDKTKRPLMAAAASALSDIVFVTSDNPRTEEPRRIIEDILPGIRPSVSSRIEPDRRRAIYEAISEARAGDVVVIAGKGHEDYQVLGTEKVPFDDRAVARQAIAEKLQCV